MIGLIICHKNLAKELINTANAILGHHRNLYGFSNDQLSTDELIHEIESFLEKITNPEEGIIFVDLRGGNCWNVAMKVSYSRAGFRVISGVNLPLILSFLTKNETVITHELFELLTNDAHRGITIE